MDKNKLLEWLIPQRRKAIKVVSPGLYHYMREHDGLFTRFHLRVETDGQGMLLANAMAAARLSPVGTMMAKGLLEERPEGDILADVTATFKGASQAVVEADLNAVSSILTHLIEPQDNYPILNLDDLNFSIFESQLIAPLEATLPLAAPAQIVPLLDHLWQVGIPHVTFFMSEEAEANHLIRAVERAEDLGMIAGVRGQATDLAQGTLLTDIAQAGVDHITVLVAGSTAVHDQFLGAGDHNTAVQLIEAIQDNEVYPMVEIALVEATIPDLGETLAALQTAGVHTFSFFAIVAPDEMAEADRAGALTAQAMPQTANWIEEIADEANVQFLWQPSVQRDPTLTLAEQIQRGPRCAGDVAVRIEANGDVIPARGPYQTAGNLLTVTWAQIWHHDVFTHYRERVSEPTRCIDCPGLVICAADCPREQAGWAQPQAQLVRQQDTAKKRNP